MSRGRLFLIFLLVLVPLGIWVQSSRAATLNIIETFSNSTNVASTVGTHVANGVLQHGLATINQTLSFAGEPDGAVPSGWIGYSDDASADWQISSGTMAYSNGEYDNGVILYENQSLPNGIVSGRVRVYSGEHIGGVIFRAQDGDNYLMADFSSTYDYLAIKHVANGIYTNLAVKSLAFEPNTYYTISIEFIGTSITVSVDGVEELSTTSSILRTAGYAGFYRQGALFDATQIQFQSSSKILDQSFASLSDGALPAGWTGYASDGTVNWAIVSGTMAYPSNEYDLGRVLYDFGELTHGQIDATMQLKGGEHIGGLIFRAQDEDNYMLVEFSSLYDYLAIRQITNGTLATLATTSLNFDPTTYYDMQVQFQGTSLTVSVDSVQQLTADSGAYLTAGKIGVYRQGSDVDVSAISATQLTFPMGEMEAVTSTQVDNVSSVALTSLTGTNLMGNAHVFVSNDGGSTYYPITTTDQVIFPAAGSEFTYQIFLDNDSPSPSVDVIAFDLNLAVRNTVDTVRNPALTQLHYNLSGNSRVHTALDPTQLQLYRSLTNTKVVQQVAIDKVGDSVVVYYGDSDNNTLDAYDITTNTELWSTPLNGYVESTPLLANGNLYIGSYDRKMYSIDASDGSVNWTFTADNELSGGPIHLKDNMLYFTDYGYNGTTKMYAIDITTQTEVWSYTTPVITFISYTLDQYRDVLYVTHQNVVTALRASDGQELWRTTLLGRGNILKQPVQVGDRLVVGGDIGLVVLNALTGQTLIDNPDNFSSTSEGIGAAPVVDGTTIYYPTKDSAKMIARNLNTGALVWSTNIDDATGTFSSPVLTDDGYLYVAYNAGMRAFRASDGVEVWQSDEPSWVENIPGIGYGYLVSTDPAGTGTMHIYRVNSQSFASSDGLTINTLDQDVTNIVVGGSDYTGFTCTSTQLGIPGSGNTTLTFSSHPAGTSLTSGMILNSLSSNSFATCAPTGSNLSFSYPFAQAIGGVTRNGTTFTSTNWSQSGLNVLSLTDDFSGAAITYAVTFINPSTNTGSSSSSSSSAGFTEVSCGLTPPHRAPDLFQIDMHGTTATLYVAPPSLNTTRYYVIYGIGEEEHGTVVPAGNPSGVRKIELEELLSGQRYFFTVAAGNDCAVGPWTPRAYVPSSYQSVAYRYVFHPPWNDSKSQVSQVQSVMNYSVIESTVTESEIIQSTPTVENYDSNDIIKNVVIPSSSPTPVPDTESTSQQCRLSWDIFKYLACLW